MPGQPLAPGFFGKMPHSGDFVSRRLPPAFLNLWDRFAAQNLVPRLKDGSRWPDHGLRFVLAPPAAPAWAGLAVPSRDQSGRIFPLAIAAEILRRSTPAPMAPWFAEIAGPALDAAEGLIDAGELDLALEGCAQPELPPGPLPELTLIAPGKTPIPTTFAEADKALGQLLPHKAPAS